MWQANGGVVGFNAASASVTTYADACCEMWQANGGVVGFYAASASVTALLLPWLECALDLACIAPAGTFIGLNN